MNDAGLFLALPDERSGEGVPISLLIFSLLVTIRETESRREKEKQAESQSWCERGAPVHARVPLVECLVVAACDAAVPNRVHRVRPLGQLGQDEPASG